jgi:hypothetical protein
MASITLSDIGKTSKRIITNVSATKTMAKTTTKRRRGECRKEERVCEFKRTFDEGSPNDH